LLPSVVAARDVSLTSRRLPASGVCEMPVRSKDGVRVLEWVMRMFDGDGW
jgi:hypothetical protein